VDLFGREWASELELAPMTATTLGVHCFDDRDGRQPRREETARELEQLSAPLRRRARGRPGLTSRKVAKRARDGLGYEEALEGTSNFIVAPPAASRNAPICSNQFIASGDQHARPSDERPELKPAPPKSTPL
jgi:hypothetical protein